MFFSGESSSSMLGTAHSPNPIPCAQKPPSLNSQKQRFWPRESPQFCPMRAQNRLQL